MLPSSPYANNSRIVTGITPVFNDDLVILCDTLTGTVTIGLPEIPSGNFNIQYRLYVKDNSNNASVNNIVINAPTGYKINNAPSFTINQNNASVIIIITSSTDYFLFSALNTKVFSNTAARLLSIPDFIGQLGVQLDNNKVYVATALTAGSWEPIKTTVNFADAAARALAVPDFDGQIGVQLDTDVAYVATGLLAGNWTIISASGSTYTNATPTPTTLGGIPAGSTFSAQTMQQMFDALLYPYQSPTFSSFAISGQTSPIEAGDSVTGGVRTFSWATTNSANINANSIAIKDVTGAVTLGSGLANDGAEALDIGVAKTIAGAGTYTWSIEATNTNSILFNRTYSVSWQFKKYYGTNAATILTETQIEALINSGLSTTIAGSYSFAAGDYKYISFPDSFGIINTITLGGFGVAMADASDGYTLGGAGGTPNYALVSVTNAFGVTVNYKLYRTKNSQVSAQVYIVT